MVPLVVLLVPILWIGVAPAPLMEKVQGAALVIGAAGEARGR
jgi:hypothetical protein